MNNQFTLIGRLTKEPVLRNTSTGKSVCEITLAVQNGKDDTSFIGISFWNKVAETISEYCKKGDLIGTQGTIKNRNWEDQEGKKHYEYCFIGNKISFLSAKNAQKSENIVQKKEDNTHIFEEFGEQVSIDEFLD